ncbi:hypothetical protein ANTPLA_LOCUS10135 [Anthophora plagiata]
MTENKRAEKELKHNLRFVQPLLRLLGIWPLSDTATLPSKILQRFTVFTVCCLQLLLLVPSIQYIILIEKNGKRKLKLALPLLNTISQTFKYIILLYRANEFKKALDEMRNDWLNVTDENRKILRDKSKKAHIISTTMIIGMYTSGLTYRIGIPLSKGIILLPNNTTMRLLPSPSYFVFNEQLTPIYEIVFTLQVIAGFSIYTIICGSIGIIMMLCLHICGLLRILVNKLIDFTVDEETDEEIVQKKLVNIVQYQIKIKR